ncbi:hypothetical protein [Streptomyces werraensis]|uniref:hypothetical protein n=1 Tax=Streptomyces werraensis TaxID=68284 RepID=UPI00341695B5
MEVLMFLFGSNERVLVTSVAATVLTLFAAQWLMGRDERRSRKRRKRRRHAVGSKPFAEQNEGGQREW